MPRFAFRRGAHTPPLPRCAIYFRHDICFSYIWYDDISLRKMRAAIIIFEIYFHLFAFTPAAMRDDTLSLLSLTLYAYKIFSLLRKRGWYMLILLYHYWLLMIRAKIEIFSFYDMILLWYADADICAQDAFRRAFSFFMIWYYTYDMAMLFAMIYMLWDDDMPAIRARYYCRPLFAKRDTPPYDIIFLFDMMSMLAFYIYHAIIFATPTILAPCWYYDIWYYYGAQICRLLRFSFFLFHIFMICHDIFSLSLFSLHYYCFYYLPYDMSFCRLVHIIIMLFIIIYYDMRAPPRYYFYILLFSFYR